MLSDYHVHSSFSFDSEADPEKNIQKAISLGMNQICFTDHVDFLWPVTGEVSMIDTEKYRTDIDLYRKKYKEIKILRGVELGLTSENADLNEDFLKKNNFDYVIGSCHVMDGEDPYDPEFWQRHGAKDGMQLYFSTVLNVIKKFPYVDTLGHMDYAVRFIDDKDFVYRPYDYIDTIDEILEFIISRGIKLEINTAPLAKGFEYPNPHPDILARYKKLGGRLVTTGSDAHKTDLVGYGFSEAAKYIKKYGFSVYTV